MATLRDPRVSLAQAYRTKRVMRSPRHTHELRFRPFQLQPFMIAPVLPGETLKNLVLQDRIVSDPINAPLIGWWCETWYFYVKHRDLADRDTFVGMHLNPAQSLAGVTDAGADAKTYFAGGGINWVKKCLQRITEEYFRDEGENWDTALLDGLPSVQISGNSVLDSMTNAAAFVDSDVDLDVDGDGTVEASEMDLALAEWNAMRDAGLVDMDYEDYMKTYGSNVRQEETSPELHRPELIRHIREWTYPTNTIDPSDGTPRSAVSWSVAANANKDRFFKEHGFIIGLRAVRPKVYLSAQTGTFSSFMNTQRRWLPAVLNNHPELSYMQFADNAGPLAVLSDTGGYWLDTRDLLVHGEQFVNYALDAASSKVTLPTAAGQRRYPSSADVDALFVSAEKNRIKCDGVTTLSILGRQVDHTPGSII